MKDILPLRKEKKLLGQILLNKKHIKLHSSEITANSHQNYINQYT